MKNRLLAFLLCLILIVSSFLFTGCGKKKETEVTAPEERQAALAGFLRGVEALREGEIAGAAIDVFSKEPIAQSHPFFGMPDKVLVTPHIGGATWDAISNHTREFVTDVKHYLNGEELEYEYKK